MQPTDPLFPFCFLCLWQLCAHCAALPLFGQGNTPVPELRDPVFEKSGSINSRTGIGIGGIGSISATPGILLLVI
jgi:hypothetical protein